MLVTNHAISNSIDDVDTSSLMTKKTSVSARTKSAAEEEKKSWIVLVIHNQQKMILYVITHMLYWLLQFNSLIVQPNILHLVNQKSLPAVRLETGHF